MINDDQMINDQMIFAIPLNGEESRPLEGSSWTTSGPD
jgi:hypothetical protein